MDNSYVVYSIRKGFIMTPKEIAQYYNAGTLGSFSTALFELIMKADENNKLKLSIVYPEYVEAYYIWFNGNYTKE